MIKKIAFIGPESTGKSTLCSQLATYYKTVWVPEYARAYMEKLKQPITLANIEEIARQQILNEKEAIKNANQILFIDTELIIAKIWCLDVFKIVPDWIENGIRQQSYFHYFLMQTDITFVQDPLRKNGNRRDYFFNLYLEELKKNEFPYTILNGSLEERLKQAITRMENSDDL